MMPVTMTQLTGANDGDLENICRTALCESFEMGKTGLKHKGHAERHIVNASSTPSMSASAKQRGTGSSVVGNTHLFKANMNGEIGGDVGGRVHIHTLYPKA